MVEKTVIKMFIKLVSASCNQPTIVANVGYHIRINT